MDKLYKIPRKSFIKRLFCHHDWIYVYKQNVFADSYDEYPREQYMIYQCKKCGGIKRDKIT